MVMRPSPIAFIPTTLPNEPHRQVNYNYFLALNLLNLHYCRKSSKFAH